MNLNNLSSRGDWSTVLLLLFFGLHLARNIFYQLFIWQLKEYRVDRMRIFLSGPGGKQWMFGKLSIIKWLLLAVYLLYQPVQTIVWPILGIFALESILIFKEWLTGVKRPQFTLKLLAITLGTVFLLFTPFWFIRFPIPFLILILDKLLPFIISLLLLVFMVPAQFYRALQVRRATKKLQKFPNLIRIGVTGSYGKSSTKEYVATLLSEKFKVVKTEKTLNTDIGIARTILKKITQKSEVLIAEMGAYKRGEIAELAQMVKPTVGIVTAINEQHLELFGSLEKTRKAKYELIDSLPYNGLAVFNADNQFTRLMAKKTRHCQVLTYGYEKSADVRISDIEVTAKNISFKLHFGKTTLVCRASLPGKQQVYAIAAAATVAWYLKLTPAQITRRISALSPLIHTMQVIGEHRGVSLIDDTFNANPDSVRAAVDFMQVWKGKKYLVLTPLIELGGQTRAQHELLIKEQLGLVNKIYLTNSSYFKELKQVAGRLHMQEKLTALPPRQIAHELGNIVTHSDVIVFEGREAGHVLASL